jgi:alkylation response protein AidB-like acyl-CoA dehydrogenase
MDFAFDEEQEELRSMARSFLADHSGSEQVRTAMESELGYDPQVWKQMAGELGWAAVTIPEDYGGLGLGAVELTALLECMGESLLCAPFFSSVCLGANALLVAGTEAQKREHLPRIAAGEITAGLADGASTAELGIRFRKERDHYELDGNAALVVDGHSADLLVVAARGGSEEIALFCLGGDDFSMDGESKGISRSPHPTMDQTRRLASVGLTGVALPASARLDGGATELREILDRAAIALAAEQVGGAQRCLDLAVAYAKEREQFGRVIGSFQALKHKCADMMIELESARSAAYYGACVAAEGGHELPAVSSLAKAACSDAYFRCAADCLQIHGGVGFTWEYDVHLYFKRARSSESLLGDPVWHRERIAREIGL